MVTKVIFGGDLEGAAKESRSGPGKSRSTSKQGIGGGLASSAKENAPDSMKSHGALVEQPSPEVCSPPTLMSPRVVENGSDGLPHWGFRAPRSPARHSPVRHSRPHRSK